MAGILANSTSKTMLAGATSADNTATGYVALEAIALSVTPTGSSYAWSIAKPSASTSRAALTSSTDASPTFTPDVEGFYTLTCVVDSVTTYVLRISVVAIGAVSTISVVKFPPINDVAVPTPATGRSIYSSIEANQLMQKLPDGFSYPLTLGGGGGGTRVATTTALKAITAEELAELVDGGSLYYVATLRAWYVWDASSTVADDTTDFLTVAVTANGVAAGRFRRLDWAHPDWLEQTAWYVSTSGSNENDGATALTPVKTDAEIQRRWGGSHVRARIAVGVTITYAEAPAGTTTLNVFILSGGSLRLVGTPTISKAGTVLTAIQSQVRTAGAEAGWAITGSGLGATEVGKLAVITASGTGANVGAYAAVLKDETGGKVRVSPFGTYSESTGNFTAVTPLVGDTIEIRDPTVLQVAKIDAHSATQNAPGLNDRVQFNDITLDGGSGASGTLAGFGAGFYYLRSILKNMELVGVAGQSASVHFVRGGLVAGSVGIINFCRTTFSSTGFLNTLAQARQGGNLIFSSDCYFQNSGVNLNTGGIGGSGCAFFDRTSASTSLVINASALWVQAGAVPDWGTSNAGYGMTVASQGRYIYATKPTINSGLGTGRETRIGGTDKLYAALPYIEPTNGAAIVVTDGGAVDGPLGYYESFTTTAALKATTATQLANMQNGQRVYVTTLKTWFAWDSTSTVADDTTDYLSVAVTANGASAGRFRRLDWAHPAWREQTAWFVSTSGSNENDGSSSGTAVKTDAEIFRRWGKQIVLGVPVTITYAQSPTTTTNVDIAYTDGGSLTLIGTPTVTKAGTVLTAVQAQVRTAGSELGWAITAVGLGSSDVGKLAVITAGTAGNITAYAAILKDETGGKVRVSPFGKADSAGSFSQVTPVVGDTIEIRDLAATTLKVGYINVRGLSQLSPVASPVQNVVVFDALQVDGSVGGGLNAGVIRNEGGSVVYQRCNLTDIIIVSAPSTFSKVQTVCGGLVTTGSGGLDIRGTCTCRQIGVLNSVVSVSAGMGTPLLSVDCYLQNSVLNVNPGCSMFTQGIAVFDRSTTDNAVMVGAASNGGGAILRQTGASQDWGTANAGHGIVVRAGASYVYATKPTINSGLGAGREVLVGGTDKLLSAVPYTEPGCNAMVTIGDNTDGSAVFYQSYANITALKAITANRLAGLTDGQRVYVTTLKAWFVWEATSTVADDATDYLSVAVTANGASAGRFRRLDWAHPAWRAQTAWFVSTSGSNENDGLTSGTPVKTDAEIQRRWGLGQRVRLSVAITITYAQSPTTTTNFNIECAATGSLKLVGTPTVTKAGTVLTAVQAQVRTAGAELGWAITGTGLGAADVGKLAVITASGTGANVGAYAAVLKDETGGKVRVSPFLTFNGPVLSTTSAVTPLVGDTIEIRDMSATTLTIGTVEVHAATDDPGGSTATGYLMFDSVRLSGNSSTFNGSVFNGRIGIFYVRCDYFAIRLTGAPSSLALGIHRLCGGVCNQTIVFGMGCLATVTSIGFLASTSHGTGSRANFGTDNYFQNCGISIAASNLGIVTSSGCAFFDRSVSDATLLVSVGGFYSQVGATPDWGTANAGHGVKVQSVATYVYATKPTINSGLGAGREALIGGTDKLYSAVPFIEPANNAALVLTA